MCHTFVSFETTYAKLIEPISYSFYKDFPKFRCHNLGPSKVAGCSVFNFLKKVLIATSFQPWGYGLFSDACLKIPKLLPIPKKTHL